jgi:hypothetical protein
MHQAAVSDRGQQGGKRKIEAQHAGSQVTIPDGNGMARAEGDIVKHAAILTQRELAIGPSVKVIKNRPRQPATSQGPEIVDTDNVGRSHRARRSGHLLSRITSFTKTRDYTEEGSL